MAYSSNDLNEQYRFVPRVRFPNGEGVNLVVLQERLQDECDSNGIPVAFRSDTLKTGGLFSKQAEEILILYNPEHSADYLQFLIRITHQGKYAFMDVFKVGGSKNFARENNAHDSNGGGFAVAQGIFNKLSGHSQKLQEEENFYTILSDCLQNIIS